MAVEELIRFQNEGLWLYGMLHRPEAPRPVPGIVMVHGFTGQRIEDHQLFVKAARALAAAGIAALRFDCRGSGESQGEFVDMTVSGEIADARTALTFLAAQPGIDTARLGVLGLSLGGCVAACLAGSDTRVRALALWTPAALLHRDWLGSEAERQLMDSQGWVDRGGNRLGRAFLKDMPHVHPLEAARHYGGPTILVYGTGDQTLGPENPQAYLKALGGPVEYVTVEGADHTFSSYEWERQAITSTVCWLAGVLEARG